MITSILGGSEKAENEIIGTGRDSDYCFCRKTIAEVLDPVVKSLLAGQARCSSVAHFKTEALQQALKITTGPNENGSLGSTPNFTETFEEEDFAVALRDAALGSALVSRGRSTLRNPKTHDKSAFAISSWIK